MREDTTDIGWQNQRELKMKSLIALSRQGKVIMKPVDNTVEGGSYTLMLKPPYDGWKDKFFMTYGAGRSGDVGEYYVFTLKSEGEHLSQTPFWYYLVTIGIEGGYGIDAPVAIKKILHKGVGGGRTGWLSGAEIFLLEVNEDILFLNWNNLPWGGEK